MTNQLIDSNVLRGTLIHSKCKPYITKYGSLINKPTTVEGAFFYYQEAIMFSNYLFACLFASYREELEHTGSVTFYDKNMHEDALKRFYSPSLRELLDSDCYDDCNNHNLCIYGAVLSWLTLDDNWRLSSVDPSLDKTIDENIHYGGFGKRYYTALTASKLLIGLVDYETALEKVAKHTTVKTYGEVFDQVVLKVMKLFKDRRSDEVLAICEDNMWKPSRPFCHN